MCKKILCWFGKHNIKKVINPENALVFSWVCSRCDKVDGPHPIIVQ